MNAPNQRTLGRVIAYDGVGLHTGVGCHVEFRPAAPGTGIRFVRLDLPGKPEIPVAPRYARADTDHMRRTILKNGDAWVMATCLMAWKAKQLAAITHVLLPVATLILRSLDRKSVV